MNAQSCATSITGKVYSPNGPTTGDPIPNILVFVADPTDPPPAFTQGIDSVNGCATSSSLVPKTLIASTTTGADGSFTLTNPALGTMGPFTLVIQAGKWRRQYQNVTANACQLTTIPSLSMPAQSGTLTSGPYPSVADLPHIAISTGSADDVECIFKKIGILDSEFTLPSGKGSINLYEGYQSGGQASPDSTGATGSNPTPSETVFLNTPSILDSYDLVIFGCQGTSAAPEATQGTNGTIQGLINYANDGGRIFATHYGYVWLDALQPFESSASWSAGNQSAVNSAIATIDQSYSEGVILAQWMQNIGASYNNVQGQVQLNSIKFDTLAVNKPPSQSWAALNNSSAYKGNPSVQFTFDTPINATTTPTVALSFANSPTSFLQGDTADNITVTVTDNSATNADSSLNLLVTLPSGLTAVSMTGVGAGTGWVCAPSTLTCNRTTQLVAGTSDSVALVVSVSPTATLGNANIVSAAIAGGGLSGTNQCGRVLFNDYHVEATATKGTLYPKSTGCGTGAMTAQEKFLEFSLYNLSNFVAPVTSEQITIQSTTTTTLTNVVSPIYYGQIIANTAIEATTGTSGAVDGGNLNFLIDGTVVCTLPANNAGACPPPTGNTYPGLYNAGTHTIQSVYVGDANYLTSSSPVYNVVVMPDPTTTTAVSSLNPSTTRQPVTFTATLTDAYAPAIVGTVAFLDGGLQIGTGTVVNNSASFSVPILLPGVHNITACLIQSTDYLASCSQVVSQIVTLPVIPATTITLLTSNVNPSLVGQAVTFSASVATTGAFSSTPTGTVTFLDGATQIGTGALNAAATATFTTASLAAGLHTITASYAGTTAAAPSVSAAYMQQVNVPIVSGPSEFLMTVAPTTLSVGVGAGVSVSVNILELNNFNQPVQLACSDLPSEMTCTFAQSLIPASGGTTQLIVEPAAPHNCDASNPYFVAGSGSNGPAVPLLAVTALGLFLARRRGRLLQGIALVAALCVLPMINGCGTGNCTDFGVKPGTYKFTVTGTSTGSPVQTQTQTMTVTVHI